MNIDLMALKKNGFMRQVQNDNLSLRLKAVGGNFTAAQIAAIAEISEKYGEGRVHITSRQGVEIPFIKLADVEAVKAELETRGLNTCNCGPRVRSVTACQGNKICSFGCIDTYPLAATFSDRYIGRELPTKMKIGVTGCRNNCLKVEGNDFGIKGGYAVEWIPDACTLCGLCAKACRQGAITQTDSAILLEESKCNNCGRCVKSCPVDAWKGEPGYLLFFGGVFGNLVAIGEQFLPIIREKEAVFRVADAALDFFDRYGKPGERFRGTIERMGWKKFKAEMQAACYR